MRDKLTFEAAIEIGRRDIIMIAEKDFEEEQKNPDDEWARGWRGGRRSGMTMMWYMFAMRLFGDKHFDEIEEHSEGLKKLYVDTLTKLREEAAPDEK